MIKVKDLFPNRTRHYMPITIIYSLIIIMTAFIFERSINEPTASILLGINAICLFVAIHPKLELKYKYTLAIVGFICLYLSLKIFYIDFEDISFIAFYIPLIYAYLLPDVLSPIIFSASFSSIFLTYIGVQTNQEIIGNMIGIISAATLYTLVSFLMDRVYDSKERYKELSIKDSLTGLYNLDYIMKTGEELLKRNVSIAVFIFDIDHFKTFNDTYGHMLGNSVLVQISERIEEKVREFGGIAGRLGGDEFVSLIPNLSFEKAKVFNDKISQLFNSMELRADPELDPVKISISIGMTHSKKVNRHLIKELLNIADMNMYYNKQTKLYSLDFIEKDMLSEKEKHLLKLLSEKDMYSYVHSKYVVKYTDLILRGLGYKEEERIEVLRGAWLHDVGKLFISNEILRKSGRLTDDEYRSIKEHVNIGLKIIKEFDVSQRGANCLKYHHERYDGSGYPFELKGDDIPLEGRILGVADAFSAMTIKRVYRRVFSIDEAIEELIKNKWSQFDPEIVDIFITVINNEMKNIENKNMGDKNNY